MKATLCLWSLVTALVCVSQQVSAGPYTDSRILQPQDNSLVAPAKRTKPSLSIVNPLDVLRQRIILEMARRQMRENTRQVERNKQILREIGKRSRIEFPEEDGQNELRFRGRSHTYYQPRPVAELPLLRRYYGSGALERRLELVAPDYPELEPRENNRKITGSTSSQNNDSSNNNNPSGTQTDRREDSSSSDSSSSSSNRIGVNRGTLMEQHRLERGPVQQEDEQSENTFRSVPMGSQGLRLLPGGTLGDDELRTGGEEEEYLEGDNNPLLKNSEQKADKLKPDDLRLRYVHNIQGRMFG